MNQQRRVSYENMARRDARTMQFYITTYGSLEAFLDQNFPLSPSWRFLEQAWTSFRGKDVLTMVLLLSSWPWAAMGILNLFRASMQQRKILPIHVLRCTIYSADMGPPLLAAAVLAGAFVINRVYGFQLFSPAEPHYWWLLLIIVWGTPTWRLMRAYQLYLRFPHAAGVVIAVQVIFFQIVALGMLVLTGYNGLVRLIWDGWL